MAEYIDREAAIKATCFNCTERNICGGSCDDTDRIRAIPAADVRPVVLCRDCKHKGWVQEPEHGKSVDYCHLIAQCVDKRFFCAAGEKREETE